MTGEEVEKNLAEKKSILEWLLKNKIRDLESFGNVMNHYYSNKEELIKEIKKNNTKMFRKGGKRDSA